MEAALVSDPTNDELLKLKTDLTEVIDLTKDLLAQQSSSLELEGKQYTVVVSTTVIALPMRL